jgi:uncharacterized protein (DUF1501 family)
MDINRRDFLRRTAAFTIGFAAPQVLSELALAQGAVSRNLVVLYFAGGNDSLSMVVPYADAQYYARRPTLGVPASSVLQIGTDTSGITIGLHPRLTGLKSIFDQGRLAIVQRTGYPEQSRSHFLGTDIWSTGDPGSPQGIGWLGRYLDSLRAPVDPLVAWNTQRETPRTLLARTVAVPAIPSTSGYVFASPNSGTEAQYSRQTATRIASHVPVGKPHLSFVNGSVQAAMSTIDRVAQVGRYAPTTTYPSTGLGQAFRAVAGAIVQGVGTRVFWVQTGGFDTHSGQGVNATNGAYYTLMATVNDALLAFYTDLNNQGALGNTLVVQFSEFGRRISENGSQGTDHGAASVMMVMGGGVRGGLHGTAANLNATPDNPTLENSGGDVRMETDFRSVYASVCDKWLGVDSVGLLGGDFRNPNLGIL